MLSTDSIKTCKYFITYYCAIPRTSHTRGPCRAEVIWGYRAIWIQFHFTWGIVYNWVIKGHIAMHMLPWVKQMLLTVFMSTNRRRLRRCRRGFFSVLEHAQKISCLLLCLQNLLETCYCLQHKTCIHIGWFLPCSWMREKQDINTWRSCWPGEPFSSLQILQKLRIIYTWDSGAQEKNLDSWA